MAAVLAALMVKLLYGTAVGRTILDSAPDAAWDSASRLLGVAPRTGVEDRQDADALAVFVICLLVCNVLFFLLGLFAVRHRNKRAHQVPSSCSQTSTK